MHDALDESSSSSSSSAASSDAGDSDHEHHEVDALPLHSDSTDEAASARERLLAAIHFSRDCLPAFVTSGTAVVSAAFLTFFSFESVSPFVPHGSDGHDHAQAP
jgi:hypothetical protein